MKFDPDFNVKLAENKPADTDFISVRISKKIMQCDEIANAADSLL